jgi:hypothetical protein
VIELGEKLELPMPATKSVYACVKLLERAALIKQSKTA